MCSLNRTTANYKASTKVKAKQADKSTAIRYDKSNINRIMGQKHVISGSLSPRHGASSGCEWRNGLQYGG